MNEDNRKKVYDVLKSQTGYRDSYEDFNKAFDANEDNRKRVYDVLKSQTGYLDSYEDFSRGMGYPSSNQPGSVSQQVVNEYEQAAKQSSMNTDAVLNDNPVGPQRQPNPSPNKQQSEDISRVNIRRQLDELSGEVRNMLSLRGKELDQEQKRQEADRPWWSIPVRGGGGAVTTTDFGSNNGRFSDERYLSLSAANSLLDEAKDIIDESSRKGNTNFVAGALRGIRDKGFDPDTWMMGISEASYYNLLRKAAEKEERGETLNAEEQQLLDAAAVNMAANAYYASDLGRGYKAGAVTAESIPFMLQFAVNPLSGVGKGLAKTIFNHGVKRFGLDTARRTVANTALRGAARVAGDAVAAAGVTATTGLGNVAEDAERRMAGDVQFAQDNNGDIQYAGRVNNVEDTGEAIARAFASTFFENQSEMVGNYFAPIMRGISKFVTKYVPGVKQLSASKVGDLYRGIKNNPTYKEFTDRTQWHGAIGEYAEEVYNNLASVAMGDMTPEELVDLDNNIDTFLGVGLMSAVFGGIGAAGFARDRYTLNRDIRRFEADLTEEEMERWQEVKQVATSGDVEGVREFVKYTMRDDSLTPQEKKDEIAYIYNVMKQSAMEGVAAEQTEEAVEAEAADILAHSDQAANTYTECNRIVVNDVGEMVEQPGHIVGYMGGQPLWIPDGADPGTAAIPLKEGEYNPESIQSMLTQEVIDETAQAIREDAAEQARRESTYSQDIVPPAIGSSFTDGTAQYQIVQQNSDGGWLAMRTTVDEKGKPVQEVVPVTEQEYYDLMQAQIDAQEQQTAVKQATDGGSTALNRHFNETAPQQPADADAAQSEAQSGSEATSSSQQGESNVPVQTEQQPSSEIPTDEKGNLLYHRAPVERTVSSINAEGLEPDEVDAFISANKDAAAKQLKSIEGKAPKMGTNIAKYKADKAAWQEKVADAQAQVDYWSQVGETIAAQRTQVGDTTAEDIRAMGEPLNGHELAAMMLATGRLPLLQSDFKRETGYKGDEARALFGLFASEANGGMTIERAGEQLMLADLEGGTHFFDQDDPNAGRNAILDVLAEVRTRGDLTNYIRRNREALAERERQAEYDAYADWCDEVMHMTPEEYEAYQEYIAENNPYEGVAVEELDRIFAESEEAYHNYIISQNNGQEGTSENGSETDSGPSERDEPAGEAGGREASVPVLSEAQPVLQGQEPGRAGGTETASGPADDGVRAAEGAVAEGASGGEEGIGVQAGTAQEVRAIAPERQDGESLLDYAERVAKVKEIADARKEVSANPTDAQKEAGNYKKGHVTLDGYDITIEKPKGSTRSGVDANGQPWSVMMNNDYGYIRGTEGVDGDHIDVFLSDDPTTGKVYVIDQVKEDGSFDEHKVMYGFSTAVEARDAYLGNYSPGWKGLGTISEVSKEEFKKWADSSHRKTKPFAEYKSVKVEGAQNESIEAQQPHALPGRLMKAYESGDKALIASVEQEMRDFVNAAKDMRSVYATYLRSKDLERSMEKGSPSNKTQHFIAETCKDVLKKAGLPAKAMQSARARTEAVGSTTDARVLDVMSADSSFDVLSAIIKNPHTSNETLERFVKAYSNNGFDYDAQQELDKRKAVPNGQSVNNHLPDAGKMNREQEEAEKIQQQSGPVEKIEDVGEKIGGAKKDRFKEFAEKEKQLQEKPDSFMEELRKLPVSKIFNFNLEALRKDGLGNEAATLIDVIRRVIPSKPRTDWKLKRWVSDVFGLYRFCLTLATAEQGTFDNVLERVTNIKQIGGMYRAQMALGGFDSGFDTGQATLEELGDSAGHYDKDGKWVSIKGQWYVTHAGRYGGIYPDYEKAKEALAQFAGENSKGKEKGTEVKFSVYSYKNSGEAFITPKGKPNIVVESGFKSSKEAMDYLNEHMDELQAKYRNMKDITSIGFAPNGERRGKDWRGGKDVTAEDFRNTFGFRGVEFGNWANQQERQRALNQAYDAFMDLSEATGISPRGLSLGGELGMAFGARGGGGAAAHYEPGKVVINLTKTQGAGTLAHEWWHAIDNYFSRRRGQALGYNTERKGYNLPIRGGKVEREHEAERKEITNAFTTLMKAINGSSYGERSNAYANLKSSYWKEPTELGARAFAVWVERKLSEKGIVNNFLANNNTIGWESPELTKKYYPYPLESDFESLDVAFDNLFGAIEEKVDEETGNTVLYRNGAGFLSDDVLSATNDPVSKLLGQSTRTANQRRAFAERERRNMAARVQELAGKLHLDNVEIVTDVSTLQGRRAKAKGFFNPATGKITIVIPNHAGTFDAEQTLLHEAVAHYGLRRLFGEHFDTFLDNVFNNADVEVRRKIVALAQKNGWDTRLATEEYLASLSEETNFDNLDASWWRKIKELFLRMLHKIGFEGFDGVTLSDNELRYILWRSYDNLREPGRYRSILGQAEDVAKQYELKVGNYAPTTSNIGQVAESKDAAKAERIRKLRESKPVEITGEEIEPSDDLKQYKKNALEYGKKLRGEYTNKDTGETISLTGGNSRGGIREILQHDYKDVEHLQSIAAIPQIIENSIFIDELPNEDLEKYPGVNSFSYYVCGLKIGKEDYTVKAVVANQSNGERYYDHKLTHIEKGKLLSIIPTIQKAGMEGNSPLSGIKDKRLLSILQDSNEENLLFRETPDEKGENSSKQDADSMNTESPSPISTPTVEAWDKLAGSFKFQLRETAVDHLTAVEKFQDLVAKHSGKEIQSFENAYNLMLALSSKTKNEMDMFDSFLVRPLNKAILELVGGKGGIKKWNWDKGPLRELVMYVEAKHGTERNRQMAVEKLAKGDASEESILKDWSEAKKRINARKNLSWMEKQRLLDEEAAKLGADLSKDYSGLSSVFKDKDKYPKGWKESAWEHVEQYEKGHDGKDIEALWTAISNATGYALQKQYESGLVSKEYVERQKERFENYVPLRGFADEIAGDVYNYMGNDFYPGGNPVKKAGGRTSEAGNPFGSILNTAYASMSTGNKNMAKLALYSLVVNHDTGGLAITNRAWMVKYDELKGNKELGELLVIPKIPAGEETPEWVEAVPKLPEGATSEEITRIMSQFEELMNKYQKADVTKPIGKKAKTAYRTLYHERDQHDIPLYIAGDKYVITVTGNPRLAQAMNGLLNPDVNNDAFTEIGKRVQRFMAGAFTAKNAAFALANLFKDSMYANNQAFIRENPKYWMKFTKNQRLGFGDFLPMMWRLYKYRKGKTMNGKTDRLFKEFMDNGGATGYTFVNNQDEYARELAKKLKDLSRKTPKWFTPKGLLKLFFDLVEFAGQSAELVNRFAAYKTSREMGRSISRSIIDAKEITVNFNRKGAGRKSADPNKSWYSPINVASAVSQYGRASIIFWNANMQAKYRLYKNLKEHPVKTSTTLIANNMAIGAVAIPLLNNLVLPALYDVLGWSSGDDDEDYYDVLTDWERTHNICIRLPEGYWLKIPLSPEMSPWYSMGDAIFGAASGKRDISATDFIKSTIDAVSPLSINWSYEGSQFLLNFLPTIGQPPFQNMMNVNFMGNPLYKTPFSAKQGFTPEYKLVYTSASPTLIELSRLSNRVAGGSDLKTSGKWADWNPATLQNLISGYTGGYGTTILSVADWIVGTSQGEKQAVTFSRMPLVSRFVISGNKDVKLKRINSSFYKVRDFVNEFEYDRKSYQDAIREAQKEGNMLDVADYISQLEDLLDSDRAKKYVQLKDLVDASKRYEDYLKEFPEDEATRNLLYGIKMEGIERLRE